MGSIANFIRFPAVE